MTISSRCLACPDASNVKRKTLSSPLEAARAVGFSLRSCPQRLWA